MINVNNSDAWGVVPGNREYDIKHYIYIYDEQQTKSGVNYEIQGPVLTFSEERTINNIEEYHSGHIKYDQTQTFKLVESNFTNATYDFINFDSAHYLYEM